MWKIGVLLVLAMVSNTVDGMMECPSGCRCASTPGVGVSAVCDTMDGLAKWCVYNPQHVKQLKRLSLSGVRVKKFNTDTINMLTNLQTLDLSDHNITDLPGHLTSLNLAHIILTANQLRHVPVAFLPKHVSSVDIRNNRVRELPSQLVAFKKLKLLKVDGNLLDCSCNNWRVYFDLVDRVVVDAEQCFDVVDGELHTWKSLSRCNDTDLMLGDSPGSGDGEILDFDSTPTPEDDLDEFLRVSAEHTDKPSTTESVKDFSFTTESDFDFGEAPEEEETSIPKPLDVEGSGFDDGSGDDSLEIVIDEYDGSGDAVNVTAMPDDDEGSGEGSGDRGGFVDFDDTTVAPVPMETEPTVHQEVTEPTVVMVIIGKQDQPQLDTNVNEELGEVVNTDTSMGYIYGTCILLCVLIVVLIALITYSLKKNRTGKRNRRNSRGDEPNGTELDNMDKVSPLLNQENEKKVNGVTESTPMVGDESDDEAPTNGYRRPVGGDTNGQVPATPPEAERVRITLTEIADSVPKTPVLVTRTRSNAGDNSIIITPHQNQRAIHN